jgi:phage terminase Nu1 subunit (DNA packaging protein)
MSATSEAATITKSALARRLDVSRARVTQYSNRGMPVRDDGFLDLSAALAWIKDNGQLQSRFGDRGVRKVERELNLPARKPAGKTQHLLKCELPHGTLNYPAARALRESANAQLAELKLAVERGELVAVETVRRDWIETLTDLRTRLLAVPPRVGATLHLTPSHISVIDAEIRAVLKAVGNADMA